MITNKLNTQSENYFVNLTDNDKVINPSKKIQQMIATGDLSIDTSSNETVGESIIYTYRDTANVKILTAFSCETSHILYNPIEKLLRKNINSQHDWNLGGTDLTNISVLSFSNNIMGDRLAVKYGEIPFSFKIGTDEYVVNDIIVTDEDIKNQFLTSFSNCRYITKKITNNDKAGLFFGQLGLILLFEAITFASIEEDTFVGKNIVATSIYRQRFVKSTKYFCRVTNEKYNISTNPTWSPQKEFTAITTIGLYDNQGILLAVAKLSQPILKEIDSELMTSIVLQY